MSVKVRILEIVRAPGRDEALAVVECVEGEALNLGDYLHDEATGNRWRVTAAVPPPLGMEGPAEPGSGRRFLLAVVPGTSGLPAAGDVLVWRVRQKP